MSKQPHAVCYLCEKKYYLYFFESNKNHTNIDCPYQGKTLKNVNTIAEIFKCSKYISIICEYEGKTFDIKCHIYYNDKVYVENSHNIPKRIVSIITQPIGSTFIIESISKYSIFKSISYTTLPDYFAGIYHIKFDFDKLMTDNWKFINDQLKAWNKIKFDFVSVKSNPKIRQYTEINSKKVFQKRYKFTHIEDGEFYKQICNLFIKTLAPRTAVMASKLLLQIRYFRDSILNKLPKDVVKIISKMTLESRYDKEWILEDIRHLTKDRRFIKFIYE